MANFINSDCSICLESLANQTTLGTLFCGHVFHHECILQCNERQRSTCPLCQKDIHQYEHPVTRLYLDFDSTNNISAQPLNPDERYEKLKQAYIDLKNDKFALERKYAQKKKRLEQTEQQKTHSEQQRKLDIQKMNAYQAIAGVLDMERQLQTHEMEMKMRTWQQMEKNELCYTTAALLQQTMNLQTMIKDKDTLLKRRNDRIYNLKKRYQESKATDGLHYPKRATVPSDQPGPAKRKRLFNPDELLGTNKRDKQPAIQLDSDEETDDPDDLFWVPPANTNINDDKRTGQPSSSSSSSSNNRTTDNEQSRTQMDSAERKQARKEKLKKYGIYSNGILPPVTIGTTNETNHNNNNNDDDNNIIDDDDEVTILYDDDDDYGTSTSPLAPIQIASPPERSIQLSTMARISRAVIELSSDDNDNYT